MIKQRVLASMALLGLLAVAPSSFALPVGLSITENFNAGTGVGNYDVQVDASANFFVLGFGVSNPESTAWITSPGDTFGCDFAPGFTNSWCYGATTLNSSNWGSEIAYFDDSLGPQTFQQAFGDFSANVEPGEATINWYDAQDGALGPGDFEDFFLFSADVPASLALGILQTTTGPELFSNQPLTNVPLPAAAWLFGSALLGLAGVARRKRV